MYTISCAPCWRIILVGKLGSSKGVYTISLVNSEVCVSGVFPLNSYQGSGSESPSTCLALYPRPSN